MHKSLFITLVILVISSTVHAQTNTVVVTPTNPQGWAAANQRDSGMVAITGNQPRAGNGSIQFDSTSAQDKADYQLLWNPANFPNRQLTNLENLEFEYYRESAGTSVPAHLHPALRLYWGNDNNTPNNPTDDTYGVLVYEQAYQTQPPTQPVIQDAWVSTTIDLQTANFWMYCSQCGGGTLPGVVHEYSTTLQQWKSVQITGEPGDPTPPNLSNGTTYIFGINTGVGSGWNGTAKMWVDQIRMGFGPQDDTCFNFELRAANSATAIPTLNMFGLSFLIFSLLGIRQRVNQTKGH